jgi:hypothetical protein
MPIMTIVNQGSVHVSERTGYVATVERNNVGKWEFVWISFFEGNEMGRGCEGPFTEKSAAEVARDKFVNSEVSKGNVVHLG